MEEKIKEKVKAVALGYSPHKERAPRIIASGSGKIAEEIMRIARENNIPFYSDKNLVEALINLEVNAEIPISLYEAVAHVLAFIYNLDKKKGFNSMEVERKL